MSSREIPFATKISLKNLSLGEASRVVGHATEDPTLRLECAVIEHSIGKIKVLFDVSPFLYAKEDNQERLQQLTTAMSQGGDEFDSITTVKRSIPLSATLPSE